MHYEIPPPCIESDNEFQLKPFLANYKNIEEIVYASSAQHPSWCASAVIKIIAFLDGGFRYCLFSPLFGEDSQFD